MSIALFAYIAWLFIVLLWKLQVVAFFFVLVDAFFAFNVDAFVAFYADAFVAFIVAFVVAFVAGDAAFFVVTGDTFAFVLFFFSPLLFLPLLCCRSCLLRSSGSCDSSFPFLCLILPLLGSLSLCQGVLCSRHCQLLFALCSLLFAKE